MIGITPSSTLYRRFSTSVSPDAMPTAVVYADNTSLGGATVAAGPGINDYRVTIAVPSNATNGQEITVAINWIVDGEPQSTTWLWVGVVAAPYATAAQVTEAKTTSAATLALLTALTELDDDQPRLTAKAMEMVLDAIGAFSGPDVRKLTILAHTGDDPETGEPVAGVAIRIAGRTITTDTAGLAEIRLNPGSYVAHVFTSPAYNPVADLSIQVQGTDLEIPIALTLVTVDLAEAPYCFTRLAVQDQFTDAAEGLPVEIEFIRFLPGANRTAVIVSPKVPIATNDQGVVERKLNRLAEYKARYALPGQRPKQVTFCTPDAGSFLVVEPQ